MTEQGKVLDGLQAAIKMETDGKKFYLKASDQSGNEVGKKLLKTLAGEEDVHRRNFEAIYEAIRAKKSWPEVGLKQAGKPLLTLFKEATKKLDKTAKVLATEIGAVQTAMEMENKTYDFYQRQLKSAASDAEKSFYKALSAQEKQHYRVLLDYYEFLKDPAAYFVKAEHPSLDGG